MRIQTALGYVFLILTFAIYYNFGYTNSVGQFFNGVALGFFISSLYKDFKGVKR